MLEFCADSALDDTGQPLALWERIERGTLRSRRVELQTALHMATRYERVTWVEGLEGEGREKASWVEGLEARASRCVSALRAARCTGAELSFRRRCAAHGHQGVRGGWV